LGRDVGEYFGDAIMGNSDNPKKGSDFEEIAQRYFESIGINLTRNFGLSIGFERQKKKHKFDLGSTIPPILVECKNHTWTETGNAPSAKLSVWNEAMLYFIAAPKEYRKILFVLNSEKKGLSLAKYYLQRYGYLVPIDIEILEYFPKTKNIIRII
jgi:hypothetical protein